ncbi:MAG: fatty acid oxidation complex subunit alpha FadJ, partial [Rhodothermia bacterium]|nr:fatty acid oxidation complex subunit alpha FadJ [Rhodothermia bacterium]
QYESRKFGELARTTQAQALMGLFLAGNDLSPDALDGEAREVRRIGILGAGLMGAGIAFVSAAKAGVDVRLKDRDFKSLAGAVKYLSGRIDKHASRLRLSDFEKAAKLNRVTTTIDYSGFESVDLVIEAVFEDLKIKQQVLSEVEEVAGSDVIFASNTSSIPISRIASGARHPQNIVGMHFFSPVDKMPLLEVVRGRQTSDQAVATAVDVGKRQGKTVIVVSDGPGFFVNRILAPYLNEASRLLVEGVSIEEVDAAMRAFGFPIGPFELMDEVGLDVGAKVVPVLEEAFGDRIQSTGVVESMVADGRLGKKSRRGFYSYGKDGKRKGVADEVNKLLGVVETNTLANNEIQKRCVSLMVNEAVHCLDDQIISRHSDGDVAAVFGIGFPPFIGGPFRYIDLIGVSAMVARMKAYATEVGGRYEPAAGLVDLATLGGSFYPTSVEAKPAGHDPALDTETKVQ